MVCTTKNDNINVSSINKSLDPYFVTGYSDGESSFSIRLRKSIDSKWGYKILPVFSIGAQINPHNKVLLEKVKEFFGGIVTSFNSLQKYPLETIIDLLLKKVHYKYEGFLKILAIKAVFPKGLSDNVLKAHPNVIPINKPEFLPKTNLLNPHWVAGFVQADGTFGLNFIKQVKMKLGFTCQPQFHLMVLNRIISTMGCGNIVKPSSGRDRYDISVANIKDIVGIVIPFFEKYPMYGAKYLDFQSFCKGHLTQQGLDQLKDLAYSMNTYRKF
ncbi:homing endonuclease [Tuber brumale]|nr:homing endonuclease [Tuber brumale]